MRKITRLYQEFFGKVKTGSLVIPRLPEKEKSVFRKQFEKRTLFRKIGNLLSKLADFCNIATLLKIIFEQKCSAHQNRYGKLGIKGPRRIFAFDDLSNSESNASRQQFFI